MNRKKTLRLLLLAMFAAATIASAARADILGRLKKGEKLSIAAIGTSLTDANFNKENWFAQMGAWLSERHPGQIRLSNRAVSGTASANLPQFDRPHGGFWQLDQVLANDDPDVVFIEFAINDAFNQFNMSVDDSRKNLRKMIEQIGTWAKEHNKSVEIIVQTMNNTGTSREATRDLPSYYQGWREEAAANKVLLIDHHANWLKLYDSEPNHETWKSYVPDDLHPNTVGTSKIILPAIQKAFEDQAAASMAPANPKLVKLPFAFPGARMESTPVVFNGRPILVENERPGNAEAKGENAYLLILDLTTGQEITRFGKGHSFVSAFVDGNVLHVFATEFASFGNKMDTKCINHFSSTDLKTWKQELAISRDGDEQFFNTSVCRDDQGYVMAYESDVPVRWCFRFARSKDLSHWEKIPGLDFADVEGQAACANPTIRYFAPYYYVVYGIWCWQGPGTHYAYQLPTTKYSTLVARSKDLVTWEVSPTREAMLDPTPGEGINNTDADLFEFAGNTYIYYATGDQATWGTIRVAMYAGPMQQMLEAYFPTGAPMITFDAKQRKYFYPQ